MNRFRPLLSAVLGLVLLVQGFAVAAAKYRSPTAEAAAAEQALPCHGQMADEAASCCCDSDCSNMATCALGHLAAAPAARLDSVLANDSASSEPVLPRASSPPRTFLRPPIVSHA